MEFLISMDVRLNNNKKSLLFTKRHSSIYIRWQAHVLVSIVNYITYNITRVTILTYKGENIFSLRNLENYIYGFYLVIWRWSPWIRHIDANRSTFSGLTNIWLSNLQNFLNGKNFPNFEYLNYIHCWKAFTLSVGRNFL